MYYVLHIYVLLSSHQIRLVYRLYTQKLWFTHVSFSDKTIRVGVWTCGQRVPTRTPLPQPHPHTHLPTSRLEWSSRTMSHLEGNSSAASSSVVASSAANSSSVEADGFAASSTLGSNPVDEVSHRRRFCNLQTRRNHGQREQQELFGHDPATYGRPEEVDCLGLAVCE